jgi:hypothetical protein
MTHQDSMVDRVARAMRKNRFVRTRMINSFDENVEPTEDEIDDARAAIEVMREPTDAMGRAMLLAEAYFDGPSENKKLTEAEADRIGIIDRLAANPAKWRKPAWRAAIDAALKS